MNAFALIMLQKRIADELGVEVGTYTHRANSFHCYERDFGLLDGYCERICYAFDTAFSKWTDTPTEKEADFDVLHDIEKEHHNEECCYDYTGEWDELMDAEKAEIAKMVEEQKNK